MVTSTSSSSGPAGAALRKVGDGSWSAGQNPVSGPGDNWSRVRDQRLKGQTGRSVLMDRWAGRPDRGPTPAGLRSGRSAGADSGFAVGIVVGVIAIEVVVEVEIVVLFVLILFVFVLFVVVLVLEVLVVEVLIIVEVDLDVFIRVVFIGVVFVGVVEVAVLQVFFRGLPYDLLLDLSIGFRVF